MIHAACWFLFAIVGASLWPESVKAQGAIADASVDAAVQRLIAAYPEHLVARDGNDVIWKDGTRMAIDDGRAAKTAAERLAAPDIKDMLMTPYPRGSMFTRPVRDSDPGRARPAAIFDKMYGDCRQGVVTAQLVDVVWLPRKWGKTVKVTRINGVALALAAVSRDLDALPAAFDAFLFPLAGTYACRPIAGTTRISAHGHGIAIDIATARADYWQWGPKDVNGDVAYRNAVPLEIVAIFEKHGFIWGGKWWHYDTMHFEYRPELLTPLATTSNQPRR
jgi:D-alanyl-D-alanine carboxypeptidase